MRKRLLAVLLGLGLALAVVGAMEWQAQITEKGRFEVVTDPPGIKYAMSGAESGDRGRGWQQHETPWPREGNTRRVICIGDSVTNGVNVSPIEAWPGQLDREIRANAARTINMGVAGWDVEQVSTMVTTGIGAWSPDILVWATYVNDVLPTYMVYGATTGNGVFVGTSVPENARILPESMSLFLVRNSALFRRFQASLFARASQDPDAQEPFPGWYEHHLHNLVQWTRNNKVPLVVIAVPPHVQANPSTCPQLADPGFCTTTEAAYERITKALSEEGIDYVDGLSLFRQSGKDAFFPDAANDPDHPNPEGQRIIAMGVLPKVMAILTAQPVSDTPSQYRRHPPTRNRP